MENHQIDSPIPARIELWGNEVDSIRLFDPATQRSNDTLDSIEVIPARESLPGLIGKDRLDRRTSVIDASNCTDATRGRITEELDLLLGGHEVEDLDFEGGGP